MICHVMIRRDQTMASEEKRVVAGVAGLEPVTSAVTGQRSNQLSYTPAKGERESTQCPPVCQRTLPIFRRSIAARQRVLTGRGFLKRTKVRIGQREREPAKRSD